jgi:hypothetical protein
MNKVFQSHFNSSQVFYELYISTTNAEPRTLSPTKYFTSLHFTSLHFTYKHSAHCTNLSVSQLPWHAGVVLVIQLRTLSPTKYFTSLHFTLLISTLHTALISQSLNCLDMLVLYSLYVYPPQGTRTKKPILSLRSADRTENNSRGSYPASSLARWRLPSNEL